MAKNLKVGMLVCASLLAANAAYAENSATQEGMRAQWKSTGDVFLFHSILYLCIMNMLEQLARIVLPKEILDNFDIVKIETDEGSNNIVVFLTICISLCK